MSRCSGCLLTGRVRWAAGEKESAADLEKRVKEVEERKVAAEKAVKEAEAAAASKKEAAAAAAAATA